MPIDVRPVPSWSQELAFEESTSFNRIDHIFKSTASAC